MTNEPSRLGETKSTKVEMTLCEALDWCRKNRATIRMSPDVVTASRNGLQRGGATIEVAVEALILADDAIDADLKNRAKLREERRRAVEDAARTGSTQSQTGKWSKVDPRD